MDLYLASAEPGLTLQEMIDFDIKGGIDFDVDPLMTSIDLSAMSALEADFTLRPFESLFDPLERPEEDEAMETGSSSDARPSPPAGDTSPIASWMNLSAMTNFNLDTETSLMVNPSVVLPSPHHPPVSGGKPSPPSRRPSSGDSSFSHTVSAATTTAISTPPSTLTPLQPPAASSVNPLALAHSPAAPRHLASATTTTTSAHHKQQSSSNGVAITTSSSAIPVYPSSRSATASFAPPRSKPLQKYRRDRTPEEKSYPKPAYSYACLIALALKNSMTGSLPVSEIYSFMCEHFPYFRTAPNGWKNSVRHNLSLNKCFEKIEKPVVSGSNQRKGCLWALNPLKAHKMDEEVQKWSKKDLPGIRDAMTCPDVLESLERGEMKFEASNGASSCSEDEEDEEVLDDHSPIKFINATPVVIPQSLNSAPSRVVSQTGFRPSPKPGVQLQDMNMSSNGVGTGSHQAGSQSGLRTSISSSPEPDFMLPDSTMSEINIQSNGAVVDDFGNEISLDGDLSILNPRTSPATSGGGTNLILKKVSASPLRSSPVRSNFVYTANSPLLPHHHQNGLNRLVLTNAKLS